MQSRPFISWLEIWLFVSSIAFGLSILFIAFAVHARKNRKSSSGFEVKPIDTEKSRRGSNG